MPPIGLWIVITLVLASVCTSASADQVDEGRTYFMRYCASCHGVEADGKGFVARALTQRPPDLKHLGTHMRDPLLGERIARYIDGREVVPAHGDREMPVWGEQFQDAAKGTERDEQASERINAIVAYLLAIQQEEPARTRKSK